MNEIEAAVAAHNFEEADRLRRIEKRNQQIDAAVLERCRIPADGIFGHWTIERRTPGVGFWAVEGETPMDVAWRLWNDPLGRQHVRVAGHCGCPAPVDPWITWVTPIGKKVAPYEEKAGWERIVAEGTLSQEQMDEHVFASYPSDVGGIATINTYHIDTEAGLRLFADAVRDLVT